MPDSPAGAEAAAGGSAGPLVEIRGLRIAAESPQGWREIVRGIDLVVRRSEVLGVIGESGAGKSTLGLAAMGYIRPGCRITAGSIVFDGLNLTDMREEEKRQLRGVRIAYVAQSAAAAFNPAHRLIDQYAEVFLEHGLLDRERARRGATALYRRLQLPDPEHIGERYPHQVSGGQLQRAMTAMAMSCRPDLIVFDEPTTALDVTTQIEVLAAIKEVVRESRTAAIYISHDLAVVAQMADRVMVMRFGELVEEGATAAMLAHPKETYTRSLWAVRALQKPQAVSKDLLLSVRGVSATYGRNLKVLDRIDLDLCRGEIVAVVGKSGSGKSTLARVITGLLPPIEGNILFDGNVLPASLKQRDKTLLRRIQMIYQMPDTALNPRRRVRDIIGQPIHYHLGLSGGALKRRVIELLQMIELGEAFLDRLPGELSGGEKQRVSIARALAVRPDVIICDEVTSALDQIIAEGILKLLIRLQQELGISYIYITHDLATVRAIADRVVVMNRGEVVQQGTKHDVLTPPHHPYTELLLSCVPEMRVGWLDDVIRSRAAAPAHPPAPSIEKDAAARS